ncbi:GIY-YIG nuclease family protein [Streptomyces sp. NPDC052236]|uniref:GIY-YIG nuclease family protein n=1 Tax=Streptomyces sp. NPDC052236 TaxID=3365686 RepID=UPI0037D24139
MSWRTGLYRLYDESGRLIYIGIATDPEKRFNAHRWGIGKTWRHDIASHRVEWFATHLEAEAAEKSSIRSELSPAQSMAPPRLRRRPMEQSHQGCLTPNARQRPGRSGLGRCVVQPR